MRNLTRAAIALGFAGALAIGSTVPAAAFHVWIGHPHHHYYRGYYNYYGGNGCPPHYTVQGGVCKPYRFGPWDRYW